jgi:hypothetical protein
LQISKPDKLALAAKLTFRNISLVLLGTARTNFCSTILNSKLIFCSMILKSLQNVFFYPRTWVTLCRVHNIVLDDVHNVAYLYPTIIVLSSNSMFHLAIPSFKNFLSDFVHIWTFRISTKKASRLNVYLTYQSISIDINVFLFIY